MRVEGVGDARRQVATRSRGPHPGDVEIGLFEVASEFPEDSPDELLGLRMMDEFWFQLSQDAGELLHREMILGGLRV